MGTLINQLAPLTVVLALAGYCCWSESDDRVGAPAKENAAKMELTLALLSPSSTPAPMRNPFPSPSVQKKAATEHSFTKEPLMKTIFSKNPSHLVLRAIYICGDRRLALINGKFYGEGDTVTVVSLELKINHLSPDKSKAAIPIIPVKSAAPIYHVAEVLIDRVVLQCENETTELIFPPADKNSQSAAPTQRVKGGKS